MLASRWEVARGCGTHVLGHFRGPVPLVIYIIEGSLGSDPYNCKHAWELICCWRTHGNMPIPQIKQVLFKKQKAFAHAWPYLGFCFMLAFAAQFRYRTEFAAPQLVGQLRIHMMKLAWIARESAYKEAAR